MKPFRIVVSTLALALSTTAAHAGFVTLDLSPIVNSDLFTYTNGTNYPGPGATTINATPFLLAPAATDPTHTGVVGGVASIGVPAAYAITGLNIANVTSMYALINSAFGTCGTSVGSIGATSSGVASYALTEGVNVRDHVSGVFCNVQTDAVATANYPGDVRFDVYQFDLSGITNSGVDLLTAFNFKTFGAAGLGEPFLAAVTFVTRDTNVPAPESILMITAGLLGCSVRRRRNRT